MNTASRIEVRERDESANDLDQGDQQNLNTTNARHTETSVEGSAAANSPLGQWNHWTTSGVLRWEETQHSRRKHV